MDDWGLQLYACEMFPDQRDNGDGAKGFAWEAVVCREIRERQGRKQKGSDTRHTVRFSLASNSNRSFILDTVDLNLLQ